MTKLLGHLGIGIGWRPELALFIDRNTTIGFVEVIAETLDPWNTIPQAIRNLRERGVVVIPHGIGLSLGSAEPLQPRRVEALAKLAEAFDAPFVSEHIAFVRANGIEAGHLLPVPRTRASLEVLAENIQRAKNVLPVPLVLENIATVFDWPNAEMDEAEFLTNVLDESDTLLLLDVANIHANAQNHHWNPIEFLDRIPLQRLAYVHIAGGQEHDGLYHDTHIHAVCSSVYDLLEEVCARVDVPGVLLERDDNFPPNEELAFELHAIARSVDLGEQRRSRS
jgi:hypothetical protein